MHSAPAERAAEARGGSLGRPAGLILRRNSAYDLMELMSYLLRVPSIQHTVCKSDAVATSHTLQGKIAIADITLPLRERVAPEAAERALPTKKADVAAGTEAPSCRTDGRVC